MIHKSSILSYLHVHRHIRVHILFILMIWKLYHITKEKNYSSNVSSKYLKPALLLITFIVFNMWHFIPISNNRCIMHWKGKSCTCVEIEDFSERKACALIYISQNLDTVLGAISGNEKVRKQLYTSKPEKKSP